jgi:hypothetical protein
MNPDKQVVARQSDTENVGLNEIYLVSAKPVFPSFGMT